MQEIRVSKREEGGTLLKLLGKHLKEAPVSFFYKMLRKKNITLNGKKAEGKEKLAEGDVIRLFLSDDTIRQFGGGVKEPEERNAVSAGGVVESPAFRMGFAASDSIRSKTENGKQPEVLYEDEDILLLNKPAGWLTQKAVPEDYSLNEWVTDYMLRTGSITKAELATFHPGVCNRLDRNTSGIVSAGKTLAGLQFLSEAFRERGLHKYYTCIVTGEIKEAVRLDGYLKKDAHTNTVSIVQDARGEEGFCRIQTAYRPIAAKNGFTYLEVELITGKTHQIRAHLAAGGHAILGDAKYAGAADELRKKYHLKYQLLHAGRIVFEKNPERFSYLDGKEITVPEPELFLRVKRQLGF